MNFLRKTFVSQIFSLSRIFSDTGRKMFKTLSYFLRQGHRKSNLCVQRYIVTKNKMFQMFQRMVFFYNCLRIMIGEVHFRKKIILLVLKTLFYVSRGTFSEQTFVSKSSFFVKTYRALRENISDFWGSCFRQGCHHSILLLPRNISGKIFSKNVFFIVSRIGAKKSIIERASRWMWNFYSMYPLDFS